MKKISAPCLLLCLVLLLQMICVPVFATETEEPTATSAAEEPTTPAELGTVTILNGCRSLEGQFPLDGNSALLDTARAAFIYERNTGTVVYAYNPDTTVAPGILVKMMTALVAIEKGNLDDEVTVNSASFKYLPTGAITSKLKEGEVLTLRDLINCMVLRWANDAAVTIAEYIAGSEESFVKLMNEKAQQIGCTGTVFTDCHGIGTAGQYTTARDLVRIMDYGMRNSDFAELMATKTYTVPETNKSDSRKLITQNYLLEQTDINKFIYDEVTGGLASMSTAGGASIVFTAEKKGLSYVMVILGAERTYNKDKSWVVEYYGNFEEAWDLLDYGFDNFKVCRLLHDGQSLAQFAVNDGENQVVSQSHTSMDAVLPINATLDSLIMKYNIVNGSLTAPIALDEKIATLQIWYGNSCIAETELYAMSEVRAASKSTLDIQGAASRDDSNLTGILRFFGIAFLVVLVMMIGYLFINNIRRAIARNRRRRRRQSRRRSR